MVCDSKKVVINSKNRLKDSRPKDMDWVVFFQITFIFVKQLCVNSIASLSAIALASNFPEVISSNIFT